MKQKIKEEQSIDILKRVAKKVEEATIDIGNMKSDLKMVSLRLSGVEHNTEIMKVDMEGLKGEMGNIKGAMGDLKGEMGGLKGEMGSLKGEMKGMEVRLDKRISHVADLITISMDQKFRTIQKRVQKIERIQQSA